MTERVQVGVLQVARVLFDFVNNEAIPGTGIAADKFWAGVEAVINDLAPKNKALLAKRDELQAKIDAWHQARAGQAHDAAAYKAFLQDLGYLLPEPADFQATTQNVDEEIATMAGPQLVVPVMNARFALNAANARWGSLYDALYGTDAISDEGGAEKGKGYNKVRGDKVIAFARAFLDEAAPLAAGSHVDSTGYTIVDGKLVVSLKGGSTTGLRNDAQLIGFQGEASAPVAVLLKHNGLHFEIQIDATSPIGQTDAAAAGNVVGQRADDHRAVGALAGVELAAAGDGRGLLERAQQGAQEDRFEVSRGLERLRIDGLGRLVGAGAVQARNGRER